MAKRGFSGSSKQGVTSKRRKLQKLLRKKKEAQAAYLAAKHGDTGSWGKLNPRAAVPSHFVNAKVRRRPGGGIEIRLPGRSTVSRPRKRSRW